MCNWLVLKPLLIDGCVHHISSCYIIYIHIYLYIYTHNSTYHFPIVYIYICYIGYMLDKICEYQECDVVCLYIYTCA
jgi:hypothetical protein